MKTTSVTIRKWVIKPEEGDNVADLQVALQAIPRLSCLIHSCQVRAGHAMIDIGTGWQPTSVAEMLNSLASRALVSIRPHGTMVFEMEVE